MDSKNPSCKVTELPQTRKKPALYLFVDYGAALGATGLSAATRVLLEDVLGETAPYITFFPAVMFSSWFGGMGPGICATVLSLLGAFRFAVSSLRPIEPADLVGAGLFACVSLFICSLNEALRRARARSDERFEALHLESSRRAMAEQALVASAREIESARDLLRVTLASIGDGVIATDEKGRITFINAVAESLTGWTLDRAVGKDITDVFVIKNEFTGEPGPNPVTRVLREGTIVGLANHTTLVALDGRETAIEDSAAPIRDSDRGLLGVVLVFRDATEHRKAEAALRLSRERLQLALRAGRIGVWDWDIVRNHVDWSPEVYEIHGVKPGEFDGSVESFTRIVHPEDRERVHASISAALTGGIPYDIEFRILRSDTELRWISTTATVFRNEAGQPVRMLGSTTDISHRREADAERERITHALAASEEKLQRILAQAPVAISTFRGRDLVVELANPPCQALAAGREMVGRRPEEILPEAGFDTW